MWSFFDAAIGMVIQGHRRGGAGLLGRLSASPIPTHPPDASILPPITRVIGLDLVVVRLEGVAHQVEPLEVPEVTKEQLGASRIVAQLPAAEIEGGDSDRPPAAPAHRQPVLDERHVVHLEGGCLPAASAVLAHATSRDTPASHRKPAAGSRCPGRLPLLRGDADPHVRRTPGPISPTKHHSVTGAGPAS